MATTISPNLTDQQYLYLIAQGILNGSGGGGGTAGVTSFNARTGAVVTQASDIPNNAANTSGSAGSFTGNLVGDVSGTQGATSVNKINGTTLSGLATGLLKNTTATGTPSIAIPNTDYLLPSGNAASASAVPVSGLTGAGAGVTGALANGANTASGFVTQTSADTRYAGAGANTNITTLASFYITSFISSNAVVTTNSTTLTNSGLAVTLPVGTWDMYVQPLFNTSGTTTTGLKWAGVFSGTATDSGTWQIANSDNSSATFGSFGGTAASPVAVPASYGLLGGVSQGTLAKALMMRGRLVVTVTGTYNWQIASSAAGTASVSILQGSLIQAFRAS